MRTRSLVGVVLACCLVFAACGGDDDDSSSKTTDASERANPDQAPADAAIAAFAHEAEDQGFTAPAGGESKGSTSDGPTSDGSASDIQLESEACKQFSDAFQTEKLAGETATAESGSYEKGDVTSGESAESVEGNVTFVEDAGTLDTLFQVLGNDQLAPCVAEAFQQSFDAGAGGSATPLLTVSGVSAAPLETSGLGDASKALGVTATVSALGRSFPVVSQFEFVQDGRAAIGVVVTVIGAEKVTADRTALAQAMVDAL